MTNAGPHNRTEAVATKGGAWVVCFRGKVGEGKKAKTTARKTTKAEREQHDDLTRLT